MHLGAVVSAILYLSGALVLLNENNKTKYHREIILITYDEPFELNITNHSSGWIEPRRRNRKTHMFKCLNMFQYNDVIMLLNNLRSLPCVHEM